MAKAESERMFTQQVVKPKRQEVLSELEMFFHANREELCCDYVQYFKSLCLRLKDQQIMGKKGKIGHITFSMLRTQIAEGRSTYLVEATDSSWVFDRNPCRSKYDAEWAFRYLDRLEYELVQGSRNYMGAITPVELERHVLRESVHFHDYVISLIRYAMPQAAALPEFVELEKEDLFEVRVGEYLDISEVVYKENTYIPDPEVVKAWLEEKNEYEYAYAAILELDLSKGDYSEIDFRFSSFNNCNLSFSSFEAAVLVGTRWSGCWLEQSDFSHSLIQGADFGECHLVGALFSFTEGNSGRPNSSWNKPGFLGVNFSGANLTGANFEGASLRGAQFTHAQLDNVNFKGADLTGAMFSLEQADVVLLDDNQRKDIIWRT
ncbi:pentapeptide repeat-containing protein [Paenibacillus melissococcoides]|uniref:Pentapeptide repeat-containing protein n=1 Tax=Paenibacillus melissococcoides TaxID=2912268 RepID=A0ABM9FZ49_9BACL|nr:pentapeptide repeat-containing protein [Paenibacillus melissococcoides]CAH8244560.1 pentapeptide repeat-containing protein [Paenibacillus melissococcoides]CAH8708345.1 pentapeptide repeat-containing protein [Paenibacillus melissococcoides]CAH8709053.1 pentapeptide repeat-containing protein [Paenibacillus melissococcoides]